MDFGRVFVRRLYGAWTVRIPTLVALHAFPKSESSNVAPEYSDAKIDVVLYFKEVDPFTQGRLAPGWQVDLHNTDGVGVGNRKRVPATFDDRDAGDQSRVH